MKGHPKERVGTTVLPNLFSTDTVLHKTLFLRALTLKFAAVILPCIFLRFFFSNQPEISCCGSERDALMSASTNATEKVSVLALFLEKVLSINM